MAFLRFLVWTAMCIGLGIFIASWEIDGKTPAQHLKAIWKSAPAAPKLDGTIDKAKKLAGSVMKNEPTETHNEADRDAVNALVAKRAAK